MRQAGLYRPCRIYISRERRSYKSFGQIWLLGPCTKPPSGYCFSFSPYGDSSPRCEHSRLPVELLRVCRRFYQEAVDILYGENRLIVDCPDAGAFQAIKRLSQRSKSALRKLHILFETPKSQDRFLAALQQLKDLCDSFSCHVRPGQLDLEVLFSVSSIECGSAILRSLQPLPPLSQLSFCTIMGDPSVLNSQWQGILRQRGRELIWACRPLKQFPFKCLPREIQFKILHHVVVTESPIPYYRLSAVHDCCRVLCNGPPPKIIHPGCCGKCRRSLSQNFCRCTLGPFFSSSCICPILDDGIFLVSKRIRRDALDTFFRSNRFLFHGKRETERGAVLGDLYDLLSKDSWIWRVKRLHIDTYLPHLHDSSTWQSVLQLLRRWKKESNCEVIFSFLEIGGYGYSPIPGLRWFCDTVKGAGFDSASVWVQKASKPSTAVTLLPSPSNDTGDLFIGNLSGTGEIIVKGIL